jgi:putative aminopeptidase FrvX
MNASGVPTGVISIPDRYVHSASEMVDLADVEGCVKLLAAVLLK